MNSDDKGQSLADRMRARKEAEEAAQQAEEQAQEPQSLADRMRARKEAEEATQQAEDDTDDKTIPLSLAERMRQKREQSTKPTANTLAEKMRAQVAKEAPDAGDSLQAMLAQAQAGIASQIERVKAAPLDEAASAELTTTITAQKDKFKNLIPRAKLVNITRDVHNMGTRIEGLPQTLSEYRRQGYIFRSYLENKLEVIAAQWDGVNERIESWLADEGAALDVELKRVEPLIEALDTASLTVEMRANAVRTGNMLEILEQKIKAAEDIIASLFDPVKREVDTTIRQFSEIGEIIKQRDEATFAFNPSENVFLVAKAEWDEGREKPNGILFLTDQRLVFEQKEKTGKKFGLFGGKQVQDILWEVETHLIEKVHTENKGMFGGKDMLHLHFKAGAPYPIIVVELKGGVSNKYWATQIKRLLEGTASAESVVEPDPELIERLRNAPVECPTCGAPLPRIQAGQTQVDCKYCGTVVRL